MRKMSDHCFHTTHRHPDVPLTSEQMAAYVRILREELVPAMGCTEPMAVA